MKSRNYQKVDTIYKKVDIKKNRYYKNVEIAKCGNH